MLHIAHACLCPYFGDLRRPLNASKYGSPHHRGSSRSRPWGAQAALEGEGEVLVEGVTRNDKYDKATHKSDCGSAETSQGGRTREFERVLGILQVVPWPPSHWSLFRSWTRSIKVALCLTLVVLDRWRPSSRSYLSYIVVISRVLPDVSSSDVGVKEHGFREGPFEWLSNLLGWDWTVQLKQGMHDGLARAGGNQNW